MAVDNDVTSVPIATVTLAADATGNAPATTALRTAITEAQSLALQVGYARNKATRVWIPPGRYLLDGKIAVPESVEIVGAGWFRTNFYYGANFPDNAVFEPAAIDWSQQSFGLDGFALYGPNSGGAPTSNQPNAGGAATVKTAVAAGAVAQSFTLAVNEDISAYASNGTLTVGTQRVRYQSVTLGAVGSQTFNNCYIVSGFGSPINIGDAVNPVTTNNVVGINMTGIGGPCYLRNLWVQYHSAECILNMENLGTNFENLNATNAGRDCILHDGTRTNTTYRNFFAQYPNAADGAGTFAALHIRGQAAVLNFQGWAQVQNMYSEMSAHNAIALWIQNYGSVSIDTFNLEGGTNLGGTSFASQVGIQIDAAESNPLTQDGTHSANISLRNFGCGQIGRTLLKDNVRGFATPANTTAQGVSRTRYDTEDGGPIAAKTYSAAITPNAGQWNTINVTNATAFTINAPFTPPADQNAEMTLEILNSSGGALGAITFNAIYKFALGAFTAPANGLHRFVTFRWNGTNWIAIAIASADY